MQLRLSATAVVLAEGRHRRRSIIPARQVRVLDLARHD